MPYHQLTVSSERAQRQAQAGAPFLAARIGDYEPIMPPGGAGPA
jgi:hypothetical protein